MLCCALKRDLWKQTHRSCVDLCFTSISVFNPWVGKIPWRRKRATHSSWPSLPAVHEARVQFRGPGDPLEKDMATHSSILDWKIPWTEEPGGLYSSVNIIILDHHQYSCLKNSKRSLAGYSPWGHKAAEQLSTWLHVNYVKHFSVIDSKKPPSSLDFLGHWPHFFLIESQSKT